MATNKSRAWSANKLEGSRIPATLMGKPLCVPQAGGKCLLKTARAFGGRSQAGRIPFSLKSGINKLRLRPSISSSGCRASPDAKDRGGHYSGKMALSALCRTQITVSDRDFEDPSLHFEQNAGQRLREALDKLVGDRSSAEVQLAAAHV